MMEVAGDVDVVVQMLKAFVLLTRDKDGLDGGRLHGMGPEAAPYETGSGSRTQHEAS